MSDDREQRVKERAYQLWESEGRPSGRQDEHWGQARREIEEEDQGRASAEDRPAIGMKRPGTRRRAGEGAPGRGRVKTAVDMPSGGQE